MVVVILPLQRLLFGLGAKGIRLCFAFKSLSNLPSNLHQRSPRRHSAWQHLFPSRCSQAAAALSSEVLGQPESVPQSLRSPELRSAQRIAGSRTLECSNFDSGHTGSS